MRSPKVRHHIRKLPAGDLIVHGAVFLLGLAFIVLGFALVVLPGPLTIPPILIGLLIWSLEFDFAERWLDKAKAQAQEAWEAARARPWRTGLISLVGLAALAAALVAASRFGLVDRAKDLVG